MNELPFLVFYDAENYVYVEAATAAEATREAERESGPGWVSVQSLDLQTAAMYRGDE